MKSIHQIRVCCIAIGLFTASASALGMAGSPENEMVLDNLGYPEGPVWHDGRLYFGEMTKHRVSTWDGEKRDTFWKRRGCGPTAIARFRTDQFAVLCHVSNQVVIISDVGIDVDVYELASLGPEVFNPNDITSDGEGGVYFTTSGHFDLQAPQQGHVIHLTADGEMSIVAKGLHYANGITLSPSGDTLLVSEHFARIVRSFPIQEPGRVGQSSKFIDISDLDVETKIPFERWGPDGLEFDRHGNLHLAVYGKGIVLSFDSVGRRLEGFATGPQLMTNVAFVASADVMFFMGSSYSRLGAGEGALLRRRSVSNRSED